MDYEFLTGFTPRMVDVVERDVEFWERFNYVLLREKTRLHVLCYVYAGKGLLELDGERHLLVPGSLFQIRPNRHMRITTQPDSPVCFFSFHFQYRLTNWEGTNMKITEGVDELPFPIVQYVQEQTALTAAFRKAFQLWRDKNSGYVWLVKLEFLNTLQLMNQLSTMQQEDSSTLAAIQKAIQYMKAAYQEPLTRDVLAEHVSLSHGYFSVSFKKHTGSSPIQYLTQIRMDAAKHLLKSSMLPIKKIAEESGFPDSFYFSRLFVKETGMSPRDYRNS